MGQIGLKTGTQFLEGFFLIAKKGKGWGCPICFCEALIKFRVFISRPVKHDQFRIGCLRRSP